MIGSQSGLNTVGVPMDDSKPSAMKVKYRLVQRWCALSLEPYVDKFGDRTSTGIQEAHVIPKSFGPRAITALEHAWGIEAGALKRVVDASPNKIPLRDDWHDCFNSSQFILLPRKEVLLKIQLNIDKYAKNTVKAGEAIPWDKPKIHHYVYIPIGDYCQTAPLFRHQFKTNKPFEELETDSGKFFRPPDFDGFPVIESTVHPYGMIWKAVLELRAKNVDELNISSSLKSLCFRALSIVECWKVQMISAGHIVPSSNPINKGGHKDNSDGSRDDNIDNDSNIVPTSDGHASSQDKGSGSSAGDNGNGAPASTGPVDRTSHGQPAKGETEVSYSNYQPSFDSFPSESSSAAVDDEESHEDENRPHDLASCQPWSIDIWRTEVLGVANDNDAPLRGDKHFLVYGSGGPPSSYREEAAAALPMGDYGHWEPDFMKRMDETRIKELAFRLGYVDGNDMEMN